MVLDEMILLQFNGVVPQITAISTCESTLPIARVQREIDDAKPLVGEETVEIRVLDLGTVRDRQRD